VLCTPPNDNPVAFPLNESFPSLAAETEVKIALPLPVSSELYIVRLVGSKLIQLGCPPTFTELFVVSEYDPSVFGVKVKVWTVPE
jgi:hypothetical protein